MRKLKATDLAVVAIMAVGVMIATTLPALADTTPCSTTNIQGLAGNSITAIGQIDNILLKPITRVYTGAMASAVFLWKSLAILEVAWFLVTTLAFKKSIEEVIQGYVMKLVGVLFVLGLITTIGGSGGQFIYNTVITPFANMGQLVGSKVGGGQPLPPISKNTAVTNVLSVGYCASYDIAVLPGELWDAWVTSQGGGIKAIITNPFGAIVTAITGSAMVIPEYMAAAYVLYVFCMLAAELLFMIIESMLVLAAGLVLLGFGASRWTAPIAAGYWRYVIGLAMKVFALELIIGLATGMITTTINSVVSSMQSASTSVLSGPTLEAGAMIDIVLVTIIIHVLSKNVNHLAMAFQGSPDTTMGHQAVGTAKNAAMGAATAVLGGVAVGGAMAATGAGATAGAAGGGAAGGAGAGAGGGAGANTIAGGTGGGGTSGGGGTIASGTKTADSSSAARTATATSNLGGGTSGSTASSNATPMPRGSTSGGGGGFSDGGSSGSSGLVSANGAPASSSSGLSMGSSGSNSGGSDGSGFTASSKSGLYVPNSTAAAEVSPPPPPPPAPPPHKPLTAQVARVENVKAHHDQSASGKIHNAARQANSGSSSRSRSQSHGPTDRQTKAYSSSVTPHIGH